MNLRIESCLKLLGRILPSLIFIHCGFGKIGAWSGTPSSMSSKGMVAIKFVLSMAVLFELGGPGFQTLNMEPHRQVSKHGAVRVDQADAGDPSIRIPIIR